MLQLFQYFADLFETAGVGDAQGESLQSYLLAERCTVHHIDSCVVE